MNVMASFGYYFIVLIAGQYLAEMTTHPYHVGCVIGGLAVMFKPLFISDT